MSIILVQIVRLVRLFRTRKVVGFAAVGLLLAISVLGNAICFYLFDRPLHENLTFADCLWNSAISITTIGYGDYAAKSTGARLGTLVFIVILGLTAFSAFLSMVVDSMAKRFAKREQGDSEAMAKDHLLIVHFPGEARVRQIIEEVRNDPADEGNEIVVISNQIQELPFMMDDVLFVRGSTHDRETYDQAHIEDAERAIVLSRDYGDTDSDAVVAAAAGVIESLNPDIRIAVECLDDNHRGLFKAVRSDAIVSGMRIAGNLMVQDMHDPGITKMVDLMTSSVGGEVALHSTEVDVVSQDTFTYGQLAKRMLDQGQTLMAITRTGQTHFAFAGMDPKHGDRLIYLGPERRGWSALLDLAAKHEAQ